MRMSIERIFSNRLMLVPFTLDIASSILDGNISVLESLGLGVDKSWPDSESLETLPKIINNLKLVKEPTGFESWMIVRRDNMLVIGDAGFKGRPNEKGEVDIGYSIIEEEQNRGYGFETAKRLADWAFLHQEVKHITASCLINNKASAKILDKMGMREVSRDEDMIYWRLSKKV